MKNFPDLQLHSFSCDAFPRSLKSIHETELIIQDDDDAVSRSKLIFNSINREDSSWRKNCGEWRFWLASTEGASCKVSSIVITRSPISEIKTYQDSVWTRVLFQRQIKTRASISLIHLNWRGVTQVVEIWSMDLGDLGFLAWPQTLFVYWAQVHLSHVQQVCTNKTSARRIHVNERLQMCQKKQASTKITCPKNLAGAEIRTRDILAGNVLTLPSVSLSPKWPPSDLTHGWAISEPHRTASLTRAALFHILVSLFNKKSRKATFTLTTV